MIGIYTILYLLLLHWVADFLFQTTEMGTQKSKDNKILLKHTGIYALTLFAGSAFMLELSPLGLFLFAGISFCCHSIQDFITSRLTSKQFAKGNYNGLTGGFTIIGIDQFLHYVQLILTYNYLTQ